MQEIPLRPFNYQQNENNLQKHGFSTIAKFSEFSRFFENNFGFYPNRKLTDFARQISLFFFLLDNNMAKEESFAVDYYFKQIKEKSDFISKDFLTHYNALKNNSQRVRAISSHLNNALEEDNFPLTLCYIPLCYGNNFVISLELNAKHENNKNRIFANAILSHSQDNLPTKHYPLPNLLDDFLVSEDVLFKALSKCDWLDIALPKAPIKISSEPLNCGFSICDFEDFFTLLEDNKTLLILLPSFLK